MNRKPFLARLVLFTVIVAFACGILEFSMRTWTPSSLQYKAVRRADPTYHHSLIPSAQYVHRSRDFTVEVKTNSLGFRDREHATDPANASKIVILGDSFVEGYGVPMESCFVSRLEAKFRTEGKHSAPVTVYGFGVAGYSPIIEYLVLKHRGLPLKPDLVILCYDMSDVQEDFLYAEDAGFDSAGFPLRVNPSWPSFGHVTLMPRGSLKTYLREHSYLYTFVADAIGQFKPKPLYEEGNIRAGAYMHTVDSTADRWQVYFLKSQYYVRLMFDLCLAAGIRFVLVTYPRGNQVSTLEWVDGKRYWGLDSLVHNSAIFGSLRSFAVRNSVPFLDMTPAFRARSKGDLFYPFDGHWTRKGHVIAADTLFSFLKADRLLLN